MSTLANPATPAKSAYNPLKIRRHVRQMAEMPDGTVTFVVKSMTRPDGPVHEPSINLHDGSCDCTCENFSIKLAPAAAREGVTVTLKTPQFLCKHLRKCLCNLERKGVVLPSSMERDFESTTICRIPLRPAGFAIVDAEDFEWLSQWNWRLHTNGYAMRLQRDQYYQHPIYMHRLLSGATGEAETDHINRNRLDNRRSNLRVVTTAQNLANRPRAARNTSGYKGVSRSKGQGRWRAEFTANGEYRNLGVFNSPEDAARAYDRAAYQEHEDIVLLNFPNEVRAIGVARKHDMLPAPATHICIHCQGEGEFECCDERGNPIAGAFICRDCIAARADDLSDAAPELPRAAQSTLCVPFDVDMATGEILETPAAPALDSTPEVTAILNRLINDNSTW